ncbi:hypothetical protein EVAR_18761_1 [Eumeta japonica]|uniref:Uncharacterized protein n=1 Tax=Eumeta variegata TaxID=151549 RepID=A0A4C1UNK0_EUMVA|nr:hypothetical protein EVAR_18761_1 [Eumeta japonica]
MKKTVYGFLRKPLKDAPENSQRNPFVSEETRNRINPAARAAGGGRETMPVTSADRLQHKGNALIHGEGFTRENYSKHAYFTRRLVHFSLREDK